jgi:hypothetical protein
MAQVAAPLTCNPTLELLERKVSRSAHAVVAITHPPKSAVKVRALSSARCLDGDQVWERRAAETEEAFERRVSKGLKRHDQSPTVVLFHPESKSDARHLSEFDI